MIDVKRIGNHGLPTPKQAKHGDAGFDLSSTKELVIAPNEAVLVPIGFAFEIPYGYVGIIKSRSGLETKLRISGNTGVIDSGYRGEIGVFLKNENSKPVIIREGDRIAQMVITSHLIGECREVDELTSTERGNTGYGSTDS